MTTLNGHFDGKHVVIDDPVPLDLRPNTKVRVLIAEANGSAGPLDILADLAGPGGLPPDFAQQVDHYLHGLPKR